MNCEEELPLSIEIIIVVLHITGKFLAAIRPWEVLANLGAKKTAILLKKRKILCESKPLWGLRSFR